VESELDSEREISKRGKKIVRTQSLTKKRKLWVSKIPVEHVKLNGVVFTSVALLVANNKHERISSFIVYNMLETSS